ncbi:dixin-A isoform X1 [Sebastes umbrosus]|uniref:dixin-A isoform X1 n=1 Tax=Sebastes umbrosus TaxID=72105 RepID=UPI0018A09BDD|nr:dixin-A isoform X1 [Sebastes umbrosus]XP_037631551.1 dixin-A isoform X1 [Sebastes umbrosus]
MGAKQMKCLSSASPAHSPKEEYVITQFADTPKEETLHDQSEDQGEPQDDKSELTEKKSVTEDVSLCGLCPSLGHDVQEEEKSWEEQLDAHQEQLEKEMQEARRMVFRLQALLLHGSLPEEDQDGSVSFGDNRANAEQQLVLIRSRLDQSMEEALDLKRELLRNKQEARHLQAIKDALQQRLAVQEDAVLQLKQELLRCNMAKDQLEGENVDIKRKLSERNKLLSEYEQQLGRKDRILQQQQQKLDEAQHKAHEVSLGRSFRSESGGYSNSVTSTSPAVFKHSAPGEELQLVREALRSLRDSFSGHDPQHHTLDTLEQGVASLMDRLLTVDSQRRQDKGEEFKSPGRRANSTDRDSWPQSSKMAHSHSSPGLDTAFSTKVLYFTDRSLTPFLINIPKRLGEVTLRDFKAAVDRQGSFRYHFKALDPEFGTVKEEVFQDGAVVPGWEGKIVAWVEEDHGERR